MTAATVLQTAPVFTTRTIESSHKQQFNELIATRMDDPYRFAYRLYANPSVAEDLVQATLIRAWKSIDRLNDATAAKGWLPTIVRREYARRFECKQRDVADVPTEGLDAIRDVFFSFALVDYHLPDGDGLTLMQLLKSHAPELRSVLMSADPSAVAAALAGRDAPVTFLEKPVPVLKIDRLFLKAIPS